MVIYNNVADKSRRLLLELFIDIVHLQQKQEDQQQNSHTYIKKRTTVIINMYDDEWGLID